MKIFKNIKWQNWILILCLFTGTTLPIKAQTTFSFDQAAAQSLTGGDYVSSINAITFFSKKNLCFYPLNKPSGQALEWYVLDQIPEATAVLSWGEDILLLFNGNYYIQYQVSTSQLISEWTVWEGMPTAWFNKLDGAVRWDDNNIFFFYGSSYVMYDVNAQTYSPVASLNDWVGWPQNWSDGVDAVTNIGDGFIYFFNQGQVISYNVNQQSLSQPVALGRSSSSQLPAATNQFAQTNSPGIPTQNAIAQPAVQNQVAEASNECLTGQSGSAKKSKLFGAKKGRAYADKIPANSIVTQVNIYSTKVWGKEVIGGVQTVIKDANGAVKELSVIGKKTSAKESISLQDGECITGIEGTAGPASDGFINSITINTSNQSSTSVGNTEGKGFDLDFSQGQFEGFHATFTNNITGIGVLHTGSANNSNSVASTTRPGGQTSVVTSNTTRIGGASTSTGSSSSNTNNKGLYTDDYFDYTDELADATEWVAQPLPGLDWLGAGIDILKYDPLDPANKAARKTFRSIIVTNSGKRAGNAGENLKPYGTDFASYNSGSERDSSSWIQSYKQFSNKFSIAASGSVEVPEVAKSSLSGSHTEINSTSVGSESIFMFNTVQRDIHEVAMKLYWKEEVVTKYEDGTADKAIKNFRQKLDPNFVDDVLKLPVVPGAVPSVKITKKNQTLPSSLNLVRSKYLVFLNKYGTHFANKVIWGGKYVSRTQVLRSDYEKAQMSETDFKNTAEVTIKKVKVGRSVEMAMGSSESNSNSKINFKREVYASGGKGETDLDKWRDKVDKYLSPVDMSFISMCDVLIEELFPNDPDIEKKKQILKIITEQYLWDNYRKAKPSRFDFFRPLPELEMPSNISITNKGGYVMWFNVKYKINGGYQTKESPNFTLGFSKSIEVPAGATDITVTASQTTGEIFSEKLDKPESTCYKCWGTIFSTGFGKCEE